MTASTVSRPATRPSVADYGLARPGLAEARAAVERVAADRAAEVWDELVVDAEARAPGSPGLREVIDAMRLHRHPLVALAALSLEVRLATFEALAGRGHRLDH